MDYVNKEIQIVFEFRGGLNQPNNHKMALIFLCKKTSLQSNYFFAKYGGS